MLVLSWFILSIDIYLFSTYYVPGTVPGAGDDALGEQRQTRTLLPP